MQRRHLMFAGAATVAGTAWLPARAAGRTVRLGQSASLTGTQAQYGQDVKQGLGAPVARAPPAGGGGGRN